MRIVIAHSHLNTLGGGERCVLELARRLGTRHEVQVWAGAYRPASTYMGFRELSLRHMNRRDWLTVIPDADVAITHSLGAHLLALRFPRTICYVHTMRSVYLRKPWRPDAIARRALDRAAIRRAAAVVTNSAYTAERARDYYGRQPEAIPPGVDEDFFSMPLVAGTYGLYVGRLAPEKGLERLLSWWSGVDADLWIVGSGDTAYVAHLRRIAGPRVRWCGPLEGETLRSRFLAFLPMQEEFGLAALEAQASGKPVLTTGDGGLSELVEHDVTGYIVRSASEFADTCSRLVQDDAQCLRVGANAREHAQLYSWDRFTTAIEQVCERVVSHGPLSH
jgi:glycosyltransferase involved in cell wall biosynthesis